MGGGRVQAAWRRSGMTETGWRPTGWECTGQLGPGLAGSVFQPTTRRVGSLPAADLWVRRQERDKYDSLGALLA